MKQVKDKGGCSYGTYEGLVLNRKKDLTL
jgi:hypothetical protein